MSKKGSFLCRYFVLAMWENLTWMHDWVRLIKPSIWLVPKIYLSSSYNPKLFPYIGSGDSNQTFPVSITKDINSFVYVIYPSMPYSESRVS